MKKILFFLTFCLFLLSRVAFPATITALTSGNWETTSTWSGGILPTCGDLVQIPAGITVTITSQPDYTICGSAMTIDIYGTLHFQNGKKLDLYCNSYVIIESGGSITSGGGGGTSNLITICNVAVWTTSQGDINGPDTLFVADSGGPLPVGFLFFKAGASRLRIDLDWNTATETNNDHFDVERSATGDRFEFVTSVKAHGDGNSLSSQLYSAMDPYPYDGTSYYRLKQVDKNGEFRYSTIVPVNFTKRSLLNVYPNPASSEVTFETSDDRLNATVEIINPLGEKLSSAVLNYNNNVDITSLPSGIYYAIIADGSNSDKIRFVVEK